MAQALFRTPSPGGIHQASPLGTYGTAFGPASAGGVAPAAAGAVSQQQQHPLPWLVRPLAGEHASPRLWRAGDQVASAGSSPPRWLAAASSTSVPSSHGGGGGYHAVRRRPAKLTHRMRVECDRETRAAFEAADLDGTGLIDLEDAHTVLEALALPVKRSELFEVARAQLGATTDVEGEPPRLDYPAFSAIVQWAYAVRDPMEARLQAFRSFDRGGRGKVTIQELRQAASELWLRIPEEELQAMVRAFDRDRDGEIDETEFVHVMTGGTL